MDVFAELAASLEETAVAARIPPACLSIPDLCKENGPSICGLPLVRWRLRTMRQWFWLYRFCSGIHRVRTLLNA